MAKVAPPNYTPIPNELLDRMEDFTPAEFKVLMAICRKTFGWHKQREVISLTQLEKMTNLSRSSVHDALTALDDRGLLERTKVAGTQGMAYRILVASDYQSPDTTSSLRLPVNRTAETTSSVTLPDPVASDYQQLVVSGYTQKKELKKLKETDRSDARAEKNNGGSIGSDRIGSVGSLSISSGEPGNDGGSVGSDRSVLDKLRTIGLGTKQARNVLQKWPRTLGVSVDAWGAWIACHQNGQDGIDNPVAYAYGALMAGNLPDQPDDQDELAAEQRKRDDAAKAREAARFAPPPAQPPPPVIPIPDNVVNRAEFLAAMLAMREASGMPGPARPVNAYQTDGPDV